MAQRWGRWMGFGVWAVAAACRLDSPGAQATSEPPRAAGPVPLLVAAASDLQPAVAELTQAFQRAAPEAAITFTLGSSGLFHTQLQQGAPHDVFLSADVAYPQLLEQEGHALRGSVFSYGTGRLVLWVPRDSALPVESAGLRALASAPSARVAIANPQHAPYGRAAQAALTHVGLWDALSARVVRGENVSQAAQFAQSGSVDAALIARSLAQTPALSSGRAVDIPPDHHPPLVQAGCIMARTPNAALARRFAVFMVGAEAQAILKTHGFGPPPAPP